MSEEYSYFFQLELHGGWVLSILKAEVAGQVANHVWDFLGGDQDSGVDGFLVLFSFGASLVGLFFGLEDFSFVLAFMSVQFDSAEIQKLQKISKIFQKSSFHFIFCHFSVVIVNSVWDGRVESQFSRSSNDVFLVDSSEWDTVDLEWTSDQQ